MSGRWVEVGYGLVITTRARERKTMGGREELKRKEEEEKRVKENW